MWWKKAAQLMVHRKEKGKEKETDRGRETETDRETPSNPEPGMECMTHHILRKERWEGHEFKASIGKLVRHCLNSKIKTKVLGMLLKW
jgi:hypothetical protein